MGPRAMGTLLEALELVVDGEPTVDATFDAAFDVTIDVTLDVTIDVALDVALDDGFAALSEGIATGFNMGRRGGGAAAGCVGPPYIACCCGRGLEPNRFIAKCCCEACICCVGVEVGESAAVVPMGAACAATEILAGRAG